MSNKRRTFSSSFKTKVVLESLREEKTVAELSIKYNVTPKNIDNWKATFIANAELAIDPSKSVAEYKKLSDSLQTKVDEYAKKVGELTLDKEFLEGKLESLALSDRKEMVDAKLEMTVTKQCELLSVPRSSVYYKPVKKVRKQALLKSITQIHEEISCYGYIKAHKQLLENGYKLRGLDITRANQVWSTDITYIKTKTGTVYNATAISDK